jgi:Domain of Unknown Function (DUF1259)
MAERDAQAAARVIARTAARTVNARLKTLNLCGLGLTIRTPASVDVAADIDVVAIHISGEKPRIVLLHYYWGVGSADMLAKGVRSALDVTATK